MEILFGFWAVLAVLLAVFLEDIQKRFVLGFMAEDRPYREDMSPQTAAVPLPAMRRWSSADLPELETSQKALLERALDTPARTRGLRNQIIWWTLLVLQLVSITSPEPLSEDAVLGLTFATLGGLALIGANTLRQRLLGDHRQGALEGRIAVVAWVLLPICYYGYGSALLIEIYPHQPLGALLGGAMLWLAPFSHGSLLPLVLRQPDPPLNLLLLRTFGDSKRSRLFGRRLQFNWMGLGALFTIRSPDMDSVSNDGERLGLILRFAVFSMVLAMGMLAVTLLLGTGLLGLLVGAAVFPLAGYAAFFWWLRRRIGQRFIGSDAQLERAITRARHCLPLVSLAQRLMGWSPGTGGCLQGNPELHTLGGYWRRAVARTAARSALVVMDLRGFQPGRAGASYELHFLCDHFPLERVLLLADDSTDEDLVEEILATTLAELPLGSPNQIQPPRHISLYRPGPAPDREVPAILQACVHVASEPVSQHASDSAEI